MLNRAISRLRSHPILSAGLIGAMAGCVNVIVIEVGALAGKNGRGVLPMMIPSSSGGFNTARTGALATALLLLVEVAGNVVGFALLFVVPVALIVGVRRLFERRKTGTVPDPPNFR